MNITDCLSQIVELTKQNVSFLKAINDSFYTKREHISVDIDGKAYAIPSFLSLENKINSLQDNIDNLVNAPHTGEAYMYFDGTTQKMELGGYATTPTHVDLQPIKQFKAKDNNIFKDFMSPEPYVRLDIASIPNTIKHVNIKKIALKNQELIDSIVTRGEPSTVIKYSDLYKILYNYESGIDYIEYDTIKRLPIRTGDAYGIYTIKNIIDNIQDDNFEEHYELELGEDLVYTINNGTIQRTIAVGDYLVTYNDKVKMIIEESNPTSRTIKVKILFGGYADLCDINSGNSDLYKLKFYRNVDYNRNKYIELPLEEDRYVAVFVASVSDTTNTQAPWGGGLLFDVDALTDENGVSFRSYYNDYVNNIGDSLYAITHMMDDDAQIEKLHPQEFSDLQEYQPIIDNNLVTVTQINKHLDDSPSVQAIRNLYAQKAQYKNELDSIQSSIVSIQDTLANTSFDDTTNTRTIYENQLADYNRQKREVTASINAVINEIANAANNSEVPIENAKYHIRGFVDITDIESKSRAKVIRMDVEYRYKNQNKFTGNAITIGDEFIYSDWNRQTGITRKIRPEFDPNTKVFKYSIEPISDKANEISFNQIDIPISQGENVDIRIRFVYNLGYPFVEFVSSWSEIFNMTFPVEYLTNVEILDIISENNNDARAIAYEAKLDQYGLIDHANDLIQDQTIKYFHQPEHIASGFYTAERRIIPLKDKLTEFDALIADLNTEVYGAIGDNLVVTISDDNNALKLGKNVVNTFKTKAYETNDIKVDIDNSIFGGSTDAEFAYSQLLLTIYNTGEYPVKFHTMFPGDYNAELTPNSPSKFDIRDYISMDGDSQFGGVYMQFDDDVNPSATTDQEHHITAQRHNQWMYFRSQIDGHKLYSDATHDPNAFDIVSNDDKDSNDNISNHPTLNNRDVALETRQTVFTNDSGTGIKRSAFLFPYPGSIQNICINAAQSYITLGAGESITIPISFYYWFDMDGTTAARKIASVTRTIAFDIRTSLFKDPVTYKLNVIANSTDLTLAEVHDATKLSSLPQFQAAIPVSQKIVKSEHAASEFREQSPIKKLSK